MQVMVDIHTSAEQFDALDKHVTAFLNSKPASYTGAHLTCANFAGDPLKFTLCVFWEFAHPGEAACHLIANPWHWSQLATSQNTWTRTCSFFCSGV